MRRRFRLAALIWLAIGSLLVADGSPTPAVAQDGIDGWSERAPMPLPTHGLTGAAYLDGWIHVPGGATRRGVSGADVTLKHQVFRADLSCGPPGATADTEE